MIENISQDNKNTKVLIVFSLT